MAAKYKQIHRVGEGEQASVDLVETADGQLFVKKVFRLSDDEKDKDRDKDRDKDKDKDLKKSAQEIAEGEIKAMLRLEHPHVVKYIEKLEIDHKVFAIIMEYCEGGNLRQRIRTEIANNTKFPIGTIKTWVIQIAEALEHVHRKNVIHRDLKPENIFLTKNNVIKLGDFGLSLGVQERSARITGFVGTMNYVAPEVFDNEEYTYRCDLWTLGVIIYELITLHLPFLSASEIMNGSYVELDSDVDAQLKQCCELLLQREPRERPRGGEISTILGSSGKLLDLAFVVDYTGSMQTYVDEVMMTIENVAKNIMYAKLSCYTRVALIKYRDHPPQEKEFVTKVADFTRDIDTFKHSLKTFDAKGGGDTPEAVADGLQALFKLSWDNTRHKVAVLVLDAPPHSVGYFGDAFPEQCPCGIDPVNVCHELRKQLIKLYIFGCEPGSLKDYKDLLAGMAHITGGRFSSLQDASKLEMLTLRSSIDAVSAPTIESEVKQFVTQLREQHGFADEALREDVFINLLCDTLRQHGYDMKENNAKARSKFRVSLRGELLGRCTSLKEMVEKMRTLPQELFTKERIIQYLETINAIPNKK